MKQLGVPIQNNRMHFLDVGIVQDLVPHLFIQQSLWNRKPHLEYSQKMCGWVIESAFTVFVPLVIAPLKAFQPPSFGISTHCCPFVSP